MGSIVDAITGSSAKKAGEAQAAGIQQGIDFQKEVFEYFKSINAPYVEQGTNALAKYADIILNGNMNAYQQSPGYQFALEEGQKAITNTAATRGGVKGGNTLRALTDYGQNIAKSDYYDYLNSLASMAGVGQTAVNSMGSVGGAAGANIGQSYANYGAARASGIAGQANTINGWLQTAVGTGAYLYGKSSAAYKKNIRKVGVQNGFNIYEFNYKDKEGTYHGVMADDVARIDPAAVIVANGVTMVNYSRIGVEFKRVA